MRTGSLHAAIHTWTGCIPACTEQQIHLWQVINKGKCIVKRNREDGYCVMHASHISDVFLLCRWNTSRCLSYSTAVQERWCQAWKNAGKETESAASARRRKAHYRLVLHTFSSFPSSVVQDQCVDVSERGRARCPQSRCAKREHECFLVSVDVWKTEYTRSWHNLLFFFERAVSYVLIFD